MRGDILFYTPKDWIGSLVAWATNGPFCHVAIDMGDGTVIEAESHGIVRSIENSRAIAARFTSANEVKDLEERLASLQKQLGNRYGAEDIVNQVLRLMGFKFYFGQPKRYDCSDLASLFVIHPNAGWLLGNDEDNPHLITPNGLAGWLGVHLNK